MTKTSFIYLLLYHTIFSTQYVCQSIHVLSRKLLNHNGCKQTREECYSLCYLLYGWSYMFIRTIFLGRRYFLLYPNILQNWYLYWNRKMSSIQTDLYRSCCNVNTVTPTKTKPPLCLKKTGVRFLQVNLTKMSYIGTLLKGWSIHQFRHHKIKMLKILISLDFYDKNFLYLFTLISYHF
jgi:hypothetical protein